MANPFTLAVLVGVSIAAVFYYVFSDSNNHHNDHHEYGADDSGGGDVPNSWTQTSPRHHGTRQRNKRRESNDTDKQTSCTICLTDIPHQQNVEVLPCGHNFHQPCIFKWQKQGPQESRGCCPNCRMKIVSAR